MLVRYSSIERLPSPISTTICIMERTKKTYSIKCTAKGTKFKRKNGVIYNIIMEEKTNVYVPISIVSVQPNLRESNRVIDSIIMNKKINEYVLISIPSEFKQGNEICVHNG
jgi:hypothetical protein